MVAEDERSIPYCLLRKTLSYKPLHCSEKLFLPLQAADLLAWQTRRRLDDLHIRGIEQKRPEYVMLEAVPLYPNRWNENRLREFLGKLLIPIDGEEKLY